IGVSGFCGDLIEILEPPDFRAWIRQLKDKTEAVPVNDLMLMFEKLLTEAGSYDAANCFRGAPARNAEDYRRGPPVANQRVSAPPIRTSHVQQNQQDARYQKDHRDKVHRDMEDRKMAQTRR